MKTLNVNIKNTDTSYPIITGENLQNNIREVLNSVKKAVLVTNETIFEIYQEKLSDIFNVTIKKLIKKCIY